MLTSRTKYALRALLYLARRQDQGPVLIGTLCEDEKLPRKFLEQILLELKNLGFLKSRQGKAGGYYLSLPAERIRIGSVIRAFNGPLALVPCVSVTAHQYCTECINPESCEIRLLMKDIRDFSARILDGTTLAELKNRGHGEADSPDGLMYHI